MLTRTLLQHAPNTKVVLIDLQFLSHNKYHNKAAAEYAYKKIQLELEEILIRHNIHFTTRSHSVNTRFEGEFGRYLEADRFFNSNSSRAFLEIFGGVYDDSHRGNLFHRNLRLIKGDSSNSLVVNSISTGCAKIPNELKLGFSVEAFNFWMRNAPDIKIFSFNPSFSFSEYIASSDVLINRHVCFNHYNPYSFPDLNEDNDAFFEEAFGDSFDSQCFMHRHQACCRKRSFDNRAKFWKYYGKKSDHPDFEWTDYLGFSSVNADKDIEKYYYLNEIRSRQLKGDSSSITPIVGAWASYIKRTSFAGEPRSPELFRKIKDRMTGSGKLPFQDPLAFDELPVFLDGRSDKLASYRIKPGMLLPHEEGR